MSAAAVPGTPGVLDPDDLLFERYRAGDERPGVALRVFYAVRPLIPRRAQLAMRRVHGRRQMRSAFPRWPIEPILVEHLHETLRRRLPEHDERGVPVVGFWPDRHRFAFVLTHDVESEAGVANIPAVRAVERRHGFSSSWNFCAEEYPIADGVFDRLRAEGCEIGLHGIDHKGKLFSSRQSFESALPDIHRYMREWGADGFRSPALHRQADWMRELDCLYDSSYPDTDPFQPQPGGCCSILPFFNGDLVELPVTLIQDHSLFVILRRTTIDVWTDKVDWIRENHGLVNVIVHPDYMLTEERLDHYDRLLEHLAALRDGWHALPRDVAAWWRRRAGLTVADAPDGGHGVAGPDAAGASVMYAREDAGRIVFDV